MCDVTHASMVQLYIYYTHAFFPSAPFKSSRSPLLIGCVLQKDLGKLYKLASAYDLITI